MCATEKGRQRTGVEIWRWMRRVTGYKTKGDTRLVEKAPPNDKQRMSFQGSESSLKARLRPLEGERGQQDTMEASFPPALAANVPPDQVAGAVGRVRKPGSPRLSRCQ